MTGLTRREAFWTFTISIVLVLVASIAAIRMEYRNNENLCNMRLSLVKTLPDSIRFFQTDTGHVCLDHYRPHN